MRLGLDVMGGDYAPDVTVKGALLARKQLPSDVELVLFGDEGKIKELLLKNGSDSSSFPIVHASEVIEMGDHPAKAFQQKTQSSIFLGFRDLEAGKIDAFASAGSTGAMMVGAMYTVKTIPGVIRPAITAAIPRMDGGFTVLVDVGINPDCKPDVLYQYAVLGSLYTEFVYKVSNPRVGLLNIGSEEEKGNLLSKATYPLMQGSKDFNFVGNVEGNDLFNFKKVDVIVCDGFVGNVLLKAAESFYKLIVKRNVHDEFFDRFNFENYGGTPVLGVNSNVIIGHGISNDIAIKNMVLHTYDVTKASLPSKIKEVFK
jgi:phosphate acyltransferase